MFSTKSSTNRSSRSGDSLSSRLSEEERYHQRVRKLHEDTTRQILRLHDTQVRSQQKGVVDMTRALESMVTRTTELVGYLIGSLMLGTKISGESLFSSFLEMLSQFSIMLGSMAIAASGVFEALFSGNPVGLLMGGLAMIAVGGLLKALATEMRGAATYGGSGSGGYASFPASGGGNNAASLSPAASGQDSASKQVVYYYHFEGGLYDERGLARITTKAINDHAGRTAPFLSRRVLEAV